MMTVIYANFAWRDQHLALSEYFSEGMVTAH